MNIKRHFDYNPSFDITAAQIGISKWDWETIDNEDEDSAKEKMVQNRFDVLPVSIDGKIEKYFCTRVWNNYDRLNLNKIDLTNSIYYQTSFKDLIRKFNEEQCYFYFLTNYTENLGLISFVNLNCQAVYNYLYHVLSDIERSISFKLKDFINQDEIIGLFEDSTDKHLKEIVEEFKDSINEGIDSSIFEYMYLQTLGITLKKFNNKLPINLKKLNKFSSKFSPEGIYGKLRNKVMHPNKIVFSEIKVINMIDELLNDYSEIKDILNEKPSP